MVVAFAVSEILAGLGRLIRERDHVTIYWVHVAWMVLAIFAVSQVWWTHWRFRADELADFFDFVALIFPALVFVLIASVIVPPLEPGREFDLRKYYFRHRAWFFGLLAASLLALGMSRVFLGQEDLLTPLNGIRIVALLMFVYLGATANPLVHQIVVIVAYSLFTLGAVVLLRSG